MSMFFLYVYKNGFMIAQIFYAAWLFPLGYLVFKYDGLPSKNFWHHADRSLRYLADDFSSVNLLLKL